MILCLLCECDMDLEQGELLGTDTGEHQRLFFGGSSNKRESRMLQISLEEGMEQQGQRRIPLLDYPLRYRIFQEDKTRVIHWRVELHGLCSLECLRGFYKNNRRDSCIEPLV